MSIIACSECAHEVSSQAAACPNCGAPIAAPAPKSKPRTKRGILSIYIALAVLCLIAATFWYLPTNQLGALLGQFSRKAEQSAPAEHPAAAQPLNAATSSTRESDAGPRAVYQI